jgi:nucleotide-binding universal stress UspA family protein
MMMNGHTTLTPRRQISAGAAPVLVSRRPFRVVAGVDWSGDSLAGVRRVADLYAPDELVLVHAVRSSAVESQMRDESSRARFHSYGNHCQQGSIATARRSLNWVSTLIQKQIASTREVCDIGAPAGVLLDQARRVGAALVVVGQRGDRKNVDWTMGSVAHRVCLNANCSTLVVRNPQRAPGRVLALVQQAEDVIALRRWLHAYPFKVATDLTVLCLMPPPPRNEQIGPLSVQFWKDAAANNAWSLLDAMVRDLEGPLLRVRGRAVRGDPSTLVLQEAPKFDLLMLHGSDRKGRDAGRSGLPWRALLRQVPCSTLVIRTPGWW